MRDRLHGAAGDRVPDGADAHRRMAAQRRDRREYTRMWQEKVEAFTQAAMAAATSAPGPVAAGRALAPVRRRVRGNARRLSRG